VLRAEPEALDETVGFLHVRLRVYPGEQSLVDQLVDRLVEILDAPVPGRSPEVDHLCSRKVDHFWIKIR